MPTRSPRPARRCKAMIAAMQTVRSTANAAPSNWLRFARSQTRRVLLNFGPIIKDFHTHIIFARNDFVAQHRSGAEISRRLVSLGEVHEGAPRTVDPIAMKAEGMDERATTQSFDAFIPMMSIDGQYDNKALDRLSKSFVELGILDTART